MTEASNTAPGTEEFPFRGFIVWLTAEEGGRGTGPPPPRQEGPYHAATAYVPPHTPATGRASFVLRQQARCRRSHRQCLPAAPTSPTLSRPVPSARTSPVCSLNTVTSSWEPTLASLPSGICSRPSPAPATLPPSPWSTPSPKHSGERLALVGKRQISTAQCTFAPMRQSDPDRQVEGRDEPGRVRAVRSNRSPRRVLSQ